MTCFLTQNGENYCVSFFHQIKDSGGFSLCQCCVSLCQIWCFLCQSCVICAIFCVSLCHVCQCFVSCVSCL